MNAKAREIAQRIERDAFDPLTMNKDAKQYMGAFDLDEAESIIASALSAQSAEIERLKKDAKDGLTRGIAWAAGFVAGAMGHDSVAEYMLNEAGICSKQELREAGVDDFDIDQIGDRLPEFPPDAKGVER